MHFAKLRLAGFKSFVEPTELMIEPGLTGVVGPNGCGKSNLVEALRWVMGENRVKQMRGGEMDDVIFAGTTSRPPRNLAEVALFVDNNDRKAPAASSRISRRFCGLAEISSEIWPWRTSAGELAPVEASANSSCTSRARTSRPLIR